MTQSDFTHIVESLGALTPEQMEQLRRELESKLAVARHPAAHGQGSIGAMRDDAELLDQAVAHALKVREERPWRLSPGE